jgi:transposase
MEASKVGILGIDISMPFFDVRLLFRDKSYRRRFENTDSGFKRLGEWVKSQGVEILHACMEATGTYGDALARWLYAEGMEVRVVNPKRIRRYCEALGLLNKTDSADAQAIADFAIRHWESLRSWRPETEVQRELRETRGQVIALEKMLRQAENRLASGIKSKAATESLERVITCLEEELAVIERHQTEIIESDEQLCKDKKILETQIGIGETTATMLLSRINFRQFDSGRAVAAYAGLVPKRHESGISIRKKGRLSKEGNSDIRGTMWLPSKSAKCHDPRMREFAEKLRAKGRTESAINCAIMRRMVVISYALLTKEEHYDPHRAASVGKERILL